MSLNAAAIELLLDKGLTGQDLLELARRMEKKRDTTNAERQARYRDRRKEGKRGKRYGNGVTPPNDIILTPSESSEAKASSSRVWQCPVGVEPAHWRDFLQNRRTKKQANSETAYQGQLRELGRLADDEWPPGRLVQYAAEKGWASICDPRTSAYERPLQQQGIGKSAAAFVALGASYDEPF